MAREVSVAVRLRGLGGGHHRAFGPPIVDAPCDEPGSFVDGDLQASGTHVVDASQDRQFRR